MKDADFVVNSELRVKSVGNITPELDVAKAEDQETEASRFYSLLDKGEVVDATKQAASG